jgi:cell division protein FtsW
MGGVIMVYSASYIFAQEQYGSSTHFLVRQLIFIFLGLAAMVILARIKFAIIFKYALVAHLFIAVLILLTFVPGVGISVKGAHRWLSVAGLNLQPGEMLKYSLILLSAWYFENFGRLNLKEKTWQILILFFPLILVVRQPDFGAFSICFSVIAFVCFLSSFPRKLFYSMVGTGAFGILVVLFMAPYRVKRIMTYLDPWKDPRNAGFQIIQSYLAFAKGAIVGQGIGNSHEKLFYLPEAHNDFILSVIGEEAGFIGVLIVMIAFLMLIYFGFRLAVLVRNKTGSIVVASITFVIGFQAFLNMGVVLGLLPTKGLNLPFVSYGGSSILANLAAIGILFSAMRAQGALDRVYGLSASGNINATKNEDGFSQGRMPEVLINFKN